MLNKSVNFKVEAKLYKEADVALKGLGMSLPEAITKYLEQIVNENSVQSLQSSNRWMDEAAQAYLEWF